MSTQDPSLGLEQRINDVGGHQTGQIFSGSNAKLKSPSLGYGREGQEGIQFDGVDYNIADSVGGALGSPFRSAGEFPLG
jgi:hypothetical protein